MDEALCVGFQDGVLLDGREQAGFFPNELLDLRGQVPGHGKLLLDLLKAPASAAATCCAAFSSKAASSERGQAARLPVAFWSSFFGGSRAQSPLWPRISAGTWFCFIFPLRFLFGAGFSTPLLVALWGCFFLGAWAQHRILVGSVY